MRPSRIATALALAASVVVAAGSPEPAAAKGPLPTDVVEKVRAFVAGALAELGVSGAAVVIVSPEEVVYAEGFGEARAGTPVTRHTPFHVASLSKHLTSIAVMKLVSDGELALDATVHSYVSWFGAEGSDSAQVTVRDLLAQTSGFTTADGLVNRIDDAADDAALERNVRRLAESGPGGSIGQFEYSNANYDILGYLVASVSGVSYDTFMAENVFAPLEMRHTFTLESDADAAGLAQGHYPLFGVPVAFDIPFVRGSVPSSFIASSAEDLGHVLIAHLNGGAYAGGRQVLPPEAMEVLRRPLAHPNPWDGYGWGLWSYPLWDAGRLTDAPGVSAYDVPVAVEHTGSQSTYASAMLLVPEHEFGVVVLLNLNDEVAPSRFYQIHTGIAQILLGHDAPLLTSWDDPLRQYGKTVLGATLILLVLRIPYAVLRLRRWRRDPAAAPDGRRGVMRHLVLPLTVDLGVVALFWWLLLVPGEADVSIPALVRLAPDVGWGILALTTIGVGWGLLRTWLTLRVMPSERSLPRSTSQ